MTLRFTNTMTGKKEEFRPLDPAGKTVTWYACGPTVYGPIHIGNARTFVVTDTIRRWIEYLGYDLRFVQNITDVDDKIIRRAAEEGISSEEVAEKYTEMFLEHVRLLGVRPADTHPRCTHVIPEMIAFIQKLIDKNHAYASEDGSVWFAVRSFNGYGKLSRRNLDDMRQGERVDPEQQKLKRDAMDFALWKAAKPGEPFWEAPWGRGRPGWHLECSCMSMQFLENETIDIHSGGVDLIFPHHENEIAQSEALSGKPFARYWLHQAMLNIRGDKMSKSLGNFLYIDKLLEQFDALTLRHFLISAHYRTELDFTDDNLALARKSSRRYVDTWREAVAVLGQKPDANAWKSSASCAELEKRFAEAMNDDFNTARALAVLFDVVTRLNTIRMDVERGEDKKSQLAALASLLDLFRNLLGVSRELEATASGGMEELSGQLLDLLIEVRNDARKLKQFALSDKIRDQLASVGIVLEDRPDGTRWKKAD